MRQSLFGLGAVLLCLPLAAGEDEEPEGLLQRIQARMRETIERQPDYVCAQTVNRWIRPNQTSELEKMDTLQLEVALIGNREVFAWKDAKRFEGRALGEIVNKGTIGTGDFAAHATNVLLSKTAGYEYKGQAEKEGRQTYRYEYGIPIERSRYRMRVHPHEGFVGYSGTFEVDAVTMDLLRLDIVVDEIPDNLGLAKASAVLEYALVPIGSDKFLLPKISELKMLSTQGEESRNQVLFSGCRHFEAESTVRFNDQEPVSSAAASLTVPPKTVLEMELPADVNLLSTAIGDSIRAVLRNPVRDGSRVIVPAGAVISARLVRLDRSAMPFDHFEVGLELEALEVGTNRLALSATLDEARGSGIVAEQKRMDPVFTKKRTSRMDILVREMPKGQGVIHCDAKQGGLKKGTQMKWVVDHPAPAKTQ